MVREIADSDDEIELVAASKTGQNNAIAVEAGLSGVEDEDQSDPLTHTIFDEFLTPTQRLSSYDGNHDNNEDITTSNVLDSSTDRFLKALATSPPSSSPLGTGIDAASQPVVPDMGGKLRDAASVKETAGKKRSRSQVVAEDRTVREQHGGSKKRTKTAHESSSITGTNSMDVLDFQAITHADSDHNIEGDAYYPHDGKGAADNQSGMVSIDARTNYTSPLDLSLHLSTSDRVPSAAVHESAATNAMMMMDGQMPHDSGMLNGNFFGAGLMGGTASKSSMGNYQSFTINPNKLGVDFDRINPFGSLSQVSLPGDIDSEETRGIAEIFRNSASYGIRPVSVDGGLSETNPANVSELDKHATALSGDITGKTSTSTKAGRENAQCSPQFSPITNPDDQAGIEEDSIPRNEGHNRSAMDVAKPVPKKRGRKPKKSRTDEASRIGQDDDDELHLDEQSLSRTTRAGTVDSVSNTSEVSHATNVSKTGRKRRFAKNEMGPPEVQSKKLPSSDLGLDNKAVIGLSPERYVPRPSRRRGQTDPEVQSEEAPHTGKPGTTPDALAEDETCLKSPVTKSKRGRKSKVKRAKTSAAVLHKQSQNLSDEDEREGAKEVAFVDEQPAKVKPQTLPESSLDGKLKTEALVDDKDADEDDEGIKSCNRRTKISVDIPVLPKSVSPEELPPALPEPKKRGRKRKNTAVEIVEQQVDEHVEREPLAEKDHNIQKSNKGAKLAVNSDPSHQDENGVLSEEETAKQTTVSRTNTPSAITPTKAATTPVPRQTHSPLKPLSSTALFNVRARIGLSKRHSIPSLLRKVDRHREAPKVIERKEKLTKRQLEEQEQERIAREEAEAEGREYKPLDQLRGKDGLLVEWDF